MHGDPHQQQTISEHVKNASLVSRCRGWSLQSGVIYGILGKSWLGLAAVQALLASEALVAMYMLLRRSLASSSTLMFDAVIDKCLKLSISRGRAASINGFALS